MVYCALITEGDIYLFTLLNQKEKNISRTISKTKKILFATWIYLLTGVLGERPPIIPADAKLVDEASTGVAIV